MGSWWVMWGLHEATVWQNNAEHSRAVATYACRLLLLLPCPAGDEVTPEERSALHTVGAAGLVAFVDVYDSLESAAK